MKKSFCDMCEAECKEGQQVSTEFPLGETKYAISVGEDNKTHTRPYQLKIVARVIFAYRNHPTGFAGPPDLCKGCMRLLLKDMLAELSV